MPKYDVAVIGAGLGGFAAAALLSVRKKKTIVIEQGPSLSDALGVVQRGGFIFSARPSLSYGFEPGGALQEFSTSIGIVQHTSAFSPCYQIALPDRRITIFPEHEATLEELRREFPDEIDSLATCYRNLETLSVRTRENRLAASLARFRSAAGFLNKFQFSREVKAFFDVQSQWFFQKPVDDLSLQSLITLCSAPPRRLQGGMKKLGEQLRGVVIQRGGEVRYNEPSREFIFRDGRVIGVKTAQGVVEADTVLLNTPPSQHRTVLFAGIREEVVPVGMSHDILFLPDYARPQAYCALSLDTKEGDVVAPEKMRALSVFFSSHQTMPADKRVLVENLGRLVPFLDEYLVFAEEFKPEAGLAAMPVTISKRPLLSGGGASLLYRTSHKNVFVLHDQLESPLQVIATVRRGIEKLV